MTPIIGSALKTTQDALVSRLKDARWETQHAGEFLMKAWLNLLVDSDNFTGNCRPSFLVNHETQITMEYDRYNKEGVAFEFIGSPN